MENRLQRDYRPTVFWSWNGDMDERRIREQVNGFAAAGVGGVFLHARAGLSVPYLGEAWFAAVRACIKACKAQGLSVWLYDENGWPSGFGNGAVNAVPAFRLKRLKCASCPTEEYLAHPLAVYRGGPGGRVRCRPGEEGALYLYYIEEPGYADLLEPEAVKRFIETVHERYAAEVGEAFGTAVPGVFTDEPQLSADGRPFSPGLLSAFRAQYGYDPLDELYCLFEEAPRARAFRGDYFAAVSRRFRESYVKPIAAWCEAHNLLFTGHFACEDGLVDQPSVSGGVMPLYAEMHIPGVDHLGNRLASPVLLKQLSSVCRQGNKPRALSETFGCMGWNAGFADFARVWGYQASLGANLACMHLGAYSLAGARKRDYPPVFSEQQPWWPAFRPLADFIAGVSRAAAEGEPLAELSVLTPFREAAERLYRSDGQRRASASFRSLVQNLLDIQADFDLWDESVPARAEGGALVVGACAYRFVAVSETDALSQGICALLARFTAAGGKALFVGARPAGAEEVPGIVVPNRAGLLRRALHSAGYAPRVRFDGPDGKPVPGLTMQVRRTREGTVCLVCNPDESAVRLVTARFGEAGALYERRPEDGAEFPLACRADGKGTTAELTLTPGEARVLVLRAGGRTVLPAGPPERVLRLRPSGVKTDLNCLTLDTAAWRAADGEWQPQRYAPEISGELARCPGVGAEVRFSFAAAYVPEDLALVAETAGAEGVAVNGRDVTARKAGAWLDESFSVYPVADLAKTGGNEIVLRFRVPEGGVRAASHEAERNRGALPFSPECVYLRGSFGTTYSGACERAETLRLTGGGFSIARLQRLDPEQSLTEQGLWFYRGTAAYAFTLPAGNGGARLYLRMWGAAAEVSVEGEYAGCVFRPPFCLDVSRFLGEEPKRMEVRLYGANRNLLGPHRHRAGDPRFVGPESFFARPSFGDEILYPEYGQEAGTGARCFVPFGLKEAYLVCGDSLRPAP